MVVTKKKEKYQQLKLKLQPFIVVVGNNLETLEEFIVIFNNIKYSFKTFIKALSVCFQLHQVFCIEYAKVCHLVWLLIESHFFEMPLSGKATPKLNSLINDLKTT